MIHTRLDHLVVMAPDLDSGMRWCERTLGVSPGMGGEHPLMGTHNRLMKIAAADFDGAYLEIIAIKPDLVPQIPAGARRWFDFDDPVLRQRIERDGPQLVHWVVRTDALHAAREAWQHLGLDRGPAVAASRMTPQGLLEWQITVREDGARLFDGCLPTLIHWGAVHPTQAMGESAVSLLSVEVRHPQAALLQQAWGAIGISQVSVSDGPPELVAELDTPRGRVRLTSAGRLAPIEVRLDDLSGPEVQALVNEHVAGMRDDSPPGHSFALAVEGLRRADVSFWSAWRDGALCGCGALKALSPDAGEVKSMRTRSAFLRQGVGQALLDEIIRTARQRQYSKLLLETGTGEAFAAAHALYLRNGFEWCGAFGDYEASEFNVFMVKRLAPSSGRAP